MIDDQPEQLTIEVPADIPLDEAIATMHRIAEHDRAGLIAAGALQADEFENVMRQVMIVR